MSPRRIRFDIRHARKRLAVVLVAWATAAVAFYLLAVRPNVRQYEALQQGTAPQQTRMAEMQAEVDEREAYL
ncbi:MAG TPA: hypothetical protein VD788_02495, partial [Candidatus Polarisedimenticolaceae bacterium]|nr:hypothetical protein [Candidatus Polarisedimenticolaceae bacterium]